MPPHTAFLFIKKGCPGKNSPLNYAYEKRPFRARFTNVVSLLPMVTDMET